MFEGLIDRASSPAALAFRLGGSRLISYAQMADDIRRSAAWLRTQKIAEGSRAVLHIADPYLHWVFFFALEASGVVSIPEFGSTPIDTAYVEWSGADVVFSSEPNPALAGVRWVTVGTGFRAVLQALRPQPLPLRARGPNDPVCVIRSSGTTGRPKKVLMTRQLLDRRTTHARDAEFLRPHASLECLLPYQSIGGILSALQTWLVGGTLVFARDAERGIELGSGRVDNLVGAPIHLERVLEGLPPGMPRPPALTIFCGGATPSSDLCTRLNQRLTDDLIISYGTTETGLVTKGVPEASSEGRGTTGSVLPWMKVEAVGSDGLPLPAGHEGELRISGEDVVAEYLDSPADTAAYFRAGWYHPGDVGIVDERGRLTVTGRVDDIINIDGRKAPAGTIETIVKERIPGISDAAAFSAKNGNGATDLWIAYCSPATVDAARLREAVVEFPRIKAVRLDVIPRNPMGKIERAALRQRAIAGELAFQPS